MWTMADGLSDDSIPFLVNVYNFRVINTVYLIIIIIVLDCST